MWHHILVVRFYVGTDQSDPSLSDLYLGRLVPFGKLFFGMGGVFLTYSARQPLCRLSDITARGHKLQGQMGSVTQAPRCFIYPVRPAGPVTLPSLTQADCSAPSAVA